jgi:PEP-CTERM motif-containing protein
VLKHTHFLIAALCFGGYAQAQSVVGTAGGTFSSLSSCDSSGGDRDCRIVSTTNGAATQLQWGSQHPSTDFVNPSTLTSVDVSFNTFSPATGIVLGQLNWYNSATLRLNDSLDTFAARWTLAVNFTEPSAPDANGSEIFNFTIRNPLNPAGDRIYGFELADLSNLAGSITLDGITLSNFRYQVTDGAGAGSSWLTSNWWYNDEYNNSRLEILADATPITPPIPEPETYIMLLAGLLSLGFAARRRGQTNYLPRAA